MKPMHLFIALVGLLGLYACDSDDDVIDEDITVNCTPTVGAFTADGGSMTINVNASREWTAFTDESWISVSLGDASFDVVVANNTSTQSREGQVTVKAGTERVYIAITQDGKEEEPVDESIVCPLDGYKLVWNDEFDTDGNLSGDWSYQVASPGWVNNELQTYVEKTSPSGKGVAVVSNGILNINCFNENGTIYSGRVYAQKKTGWKYGYFEASIKLPSGKGSWPAYWMMPVNFTSWPADGEIDIMEEVGCNANYCSSTVHCNKYNNTNTSIEHAEKKISTAESDFHLYALEWTEDYMTFYQDNKAILTYKNDGTGKDAWPFNASFYIILNLAWGGSWGGMYGVDESALPITMQVDYVRVFQKK